MKRLLIILLVCSAAEAANEINAFCPGVTTAYSVVREADGDVWYVSGQVFEAWGTGARTAADYDIALTDKSGDMFVGSMDTNISSGNYHIVTHYQAGGAPADTDPVVWVEFGNWTGSVWTATTISTADIADAVWDEAIADHTTETSFGGEVGGLDPNLTLVLADTDELQIDWANGGRLDLLIDGIKAVTDILIAVDETIASVTDANTFVITHTGDVNDVNDTYNGMTIYVQDATTDDWESRLIIDWETGYEVTVDEPFTFTPEVGDRVVFWGQAYFPMDIWDSLPLPLPKPVVNIVDRTAGGGSGGTKTLDWEGLDP